MTSLRLFAPCCKLDFHKDDHPSSVVLNVSNEKNLNIKLLMLMMMISAMMIKCPRAPFICECTTESSANKTSLNYYFFVYLLFFSFLCSTQIINISLSLCLK